MAKKILPYVAMALYEEEKAIELQELMLYKQQIDEEIKETFEEYEKACKESDMWLEYLESRDVWGPLDPQDSLQALLEELWKAEFEKSEAPRDEDFEMIVYADEDDEETRVYKQRSRAYHRNQARRSKKRVCRNANIAMRNMRKRMLEDMHNVAHCKRRGGQIALHKSKSMKTEELWVRATKMKLVEE